MKEDLMAPRYKVIADFWDNPFNVGDILTFLYLREPMLPPIEELISGVVTKYLYTDFIEDKNGKGSASYAEIQFKKYPNLFQWLGWWEYREEEDLPEYLKIIAAKNEEDKGLVFKVDRYEPYYVEDAEMPNDAFLVYSESINDCIPIIFGDPATKEEYAAQSAPVERSVATTSPQTTKG